MDEVVAIIVRILARCAGLAHLLPGVRYAEYVPGEKVRILLVGYNGARNTGSDVRVAALAERLVQAFGYDNVQLSVMSFDPESTAPYFEGTARQFPFSTVFFLPLMKACSEHHVAILCEGSTFKSKFADALTLYSCEAAGVMRTQGKPCIAFGGEIGDMTPNASRAVRDLCRDVRFFARSAASYDAARRLGLKARQGTDTAWTFDSSRGREQAIRLLRDGGWDGKRPLLGIAPVNPFWWPVKPSLWKWARSAFGDDRLLQFQKWYFFSWSADRDRRYQRYLDDMATSTATFARENGYMPVVVGMEKLDEDACMRLAARLGGDVSVLLSRDHDGYMLGEVLRSLSLLVTSRYHAQVLAAKADVPAVSVSMDERLDNLVDELGLPEDLLLHVDQPDLGPRILVALDYARDNRKELSAHLQARHAELAVLLDDMTRWFADCLAEHGIACQ